MVKKTWLLCLLFLFCIRAMPVQSQATFTNPGASQLHACGLPTNRSIFTDSATFTTFNLTADCTIGAAAVPTNGIYLHFQSGTFTINGNGHSIIGRRNSWTIIVGLNTSDTSTVLNLNDITIRDAGYDNAAQQAVIVQRGARLNGRNVIFSGNRGSNGAVLAFQNGKVYLENAQFLNNRQTHGALGEASAAAAAGVFGSPAANTVLSINGGIFEGNTSVLQSARVILASAGTVQLQGCVIFRNNAGAIYSTRSISNVAGVITDTTTNQDDRTRCPKPPKRKKEKIPTATATLRPLATTCIDLNQATGIAVHATYGLTSGVQCQRLDGGGIGVQAIVDGGFIDAVDIWGYVEQGVEVCFPQAGELLFLDARTMPRAIAPLAATVVNGMTCGAIETPGSIVLMPPS